MEATIDKPTHRIGEHCTDTCKPATWLVGLEEHGRWQVHQADPEDRTICGWGNSATLVEVQHAEMPWVDGAHICQNCFDSEAVAVVARWLA